MSRSLVLGNGSLLVGINNRGLIRDFYFDYVGQENHMSKNSVHLVGVWVDYGGGNTQLSWLTDQQWNITIDYQHETLAGITIAKNESLGVELNILDLVYNEKPIFIRKFTVKNLIDTKRTIKVFLNHQFTMYGVSSKDTVFFDPEDNTIIHYKGRRIALIGGKMNGDSFSDYTVGLSGIEGKQGTWYDALDGRLDQNPIEHGSVDSTICFENTPDANSKFDFTCWVAMGKTNYEVKELHKYIQTKSPEHLIETTQDFWSAWVNKCKYNFYGLTPQVEELFKKSLLIMRTHVDNNGGIIASADSEMLQYGRDNYSYVWPRDGAYVAIAFDKAGYPEVSRRFFEFANDVISEEGYFFHKYCNDKSWGSSWHPWVVDGVRQLPIQEDETAQVIIALWEHYKYSKDLEFIEQVYNSLIKKAGSFMLGFRNESKLPFGSYDLWEMKFGVNTYTAGSVYAALNVVSHFADLLGKEKDKNIFSSAAQEVKSAAQELLVNPENSFFYKLIDFSEGKILHDKTLDMSSFYAMFNFGIFDITDPILQKAKDVVEQNLLLPGDNGGIIRFEDDKYYRDNPSSKGNPWIITTLWLAQFYIKKAKSQDDLMPVVKWINWVVGKTLPSGILSEQINPETGQQVSASPLSWSHAEFIITIISYLEKLQELDICETCYPINK